MDFVVKIFSDRFKYKAAMLIEWLAKPITEHLAEALHTHHDKDKAWKLEASLCAGGAWQVASTVFQRLQDPRILRVLEADATKPGGEEDSAEEREFTILAARGLGLAWRLAKYWTLAHLRHIGPCLTRSACCCARPDPRICTWGSPGQKSCSNTCAVASSWPLQAHSLKVC